MPASSEASLIHAVAFARTYSASWTFSRSCPSASTMIRRVVTLIFDSLTHCCERRPFHSVLLRKWVLIENVSSLLSPKLETTWQYICQALCFNCHLQLSWQNFSRRKFNLRWTCASGKNVGIQVPLYVRQGPLNVARCFARGSSSWP